jgi:hypothetical protein
MNLQEWRERQSRGEDAKLPSGLVVQIRQVSMLDLAAGGKIPAVLKPQLDALIGGNGVKMTIDRLGQFVEVVDLVCGACIVGPDGLKVAELPYQDRIAIFNWANEAGGKLQPFREQQAELVGA